MKALFNEFFIDCFSILLSYIRFWFYLWSVAFLLGGVYGVIIALGDFRSIFEIFETAWLVGAGLIIFGFVPISVILVGLFILLLIIWGPILLLRAMKKDTQVTFANN